MKKFAALTALIILLSLCRTAGAACTGSSPTYSTTADISSFMTCANKLVTGDTLNIGSGSFDIASTITIPQSVHIHGSGTTITSSIVKPLVFTVTGAQCTTLPLEVDGITFTSSYTNNSGTGNASIFIQSPTGAAGCHAFLIHNNLFNYTSTGSNIAVAVAGDTYGVIYLNTIDWRTVANANAFFVSITAPSWHNPASSYGLDVYGDGAWTAVPDYSSQNHVIVEGNNTLSNAGQQNGFAYYDKGATPIFRWNTDNGGVFTNHGFDSNGPRYRSYRWGIGYNNVINGNGSGYSVAWTFRGGTGFFYNNNISGWGNNHPIFAKTYRYIDAILSGGQTLGGTYGINATSGMCWPADSGNTNSVCYNNTTGLMNGNCTGPHYSCSNSNTQGCKGPTDTTSCGAGTCLGPIDNPSGSGAGNPCEDAIGHGQDTGFGTVQNTEPIFVWNNPPGITMTVSADAVEGQQYLTDYGGDISTGSGAPSGSCSAGTAYWDTDGLALYNCVATVWNLYYTQPACPATLTGLTNSCLVSTPGVSGYNAGPPLWSIGLTAGPGGCIVAGTGATCSSSNSVSVGNGSSPSFTISPNPGYYITGVQQDSSSVYWGGNPLTGSVSFTNVTAGGHQISATFLPIPSALPTVVSLSGGDKGSYLPGGNTVQGQYAPPCAPPVAPTLGAVSETGTSITQAWSDSDPSITSYNISYGLNTGYGTTIGGVTSPYAITGLTANTLYYFEVTAINSCGSTSVAGSATTATASASLNADVFTNFENGSVTSPLTLWTVANLTSATQCSGGSCGSGNGAGTWLRHWGSGTAGNFWSSYVNSASVALPATIALSGNGGSPFATTGSLGFYQDLSSAAYINYQCTAAGQGPGGDTNWLLCTGLHTGGYLGINNINYAGPNTGCTSNGYMAGTVPMSCCTGANVGSCGGAVGGSMGNGCISADIPWVCCTGLNTGNCGGSESAYYNLTNLPANGIAVGVLATFDMTGGGESSTNLPYWGIKQNPTSSWLNANVQLPAAGGGGQPYIRTETSAFSPKAGCIGNQNPWLCCTGSNTGCSAAAVYGSPINLNNAQTYWETALYVEGPTTPGSACPNGIGCSFAGTSYNCTGVGTCTWGTGNTCMCCTGNGVGNCGYVELAVFYPLSPPTQVGSISWGPLGSGATQIGVSLGKDGNGNWPWSAGKVLLDNMVINTSNPVANFPLGP